MKSPTFRGKPSDAHVIWRRSGAGAAGDKLFDEAALRNWCSARGADFETSKRVDHERSDRPRKQYRCVFRWSESERESFEVGDEQWEIETGKTPRTFIEIDSEGEARIESWDAEYLLDIQELRLDGPAIVFRAAEFDGTKRLDARKLRSEPE